MKDDVLADACERIFVKIENILKDKSSTSHEKYRNLWKLMKEEDNEIALMFDDLKRSNAMLKLAYWKKNGLLTKEQCEQFSEETQESVTLWSKEVNRE